MALIHPRSLERWQEWRGSRRRVRGIHRSRPLDVATEGYVLHTREGEGPSRILLGIDTADGAAHGGLPAVLPYVHGSAAVVTPAGLSPAELSGPEWEHRRIARPSAALDDLGITSLLTLGWHRAVGRSLHEWAREAEVPGAVVQHDVLTPFAPPLPPDTTLLSWTAEDGEFHRAERDDIEVRVVGSQRLWQARHDAAGQEPTIDGQPVFLGQLASIELPRRVSLRAAHSYCRFADALYQPGPGEDDRLARAAHLLLRRRGIAFQDPSTALPAQSGPIAAVFSADILEAAVRGIPAWVHAPGAPGWLVEQWERYGMRRAGTEPTPAPELGTDEPARLIAQILEGGA